MKQFILALALGLPISVLGAQPVFASGEIEAACLKSERSAATRSLCACLQTVADSVLSAADQRRGAAFFTNPHMSQEVLAASRTGTDRFWGRWEKFADASVKHCQ